MNALNPYNTAAEISPAVAHQNAVAEATSAREVAEVQAAMAIAKRFPRDPREAMDRILNACTRPTLAEKALYTYSRGGTEITGPSIRLAEAMAQAWGNMQIGVRELSQDSGVSTVEAFAWDIETNTRQSKVFQVSHIRHTKQGAKLLTDPRDIYENVANNGARRLRACILGIIPGDVTEAAVLQCEETATVSADVSPDGIKFMLSAFAEFGVTKDQIEAKIQSHIESIRPAQKVNLKKIYNSMRDGMSKPEDWFEPSKSADLPPPAPVVKPGASRASQLAADLSAAGIKPPLGSESAT